MMALFILLLCCPSCLHTECGLRAGFAAGAASAGFPRPWRVRLQPLPQRNFAQSWRRSSIALRPLFWCLLAAVQPFPQSGFSSAGASASALTSSGLFPLPWMAIKCSTFPRSGPPLITTSVLLQPSQAAPRLPASTPSPSTRKQQSFLPPGAQASGVPPGSWLPLTPQVTERPLPPQGGNGAVWAIRTIR